MKKILFSFATIVVALLSSCSSGSNSKMISPTSTEFTSGQLARYIEVEDAPAELTFAEIEGGLAATQYIRLKVTLKLVKDGFKNIDARDIDFTTLLSVATINLIDENGIEVQDLSVKSEDLLKLKKLLTGDEGDTSEIIFEGEFHNHDDAPIWFKSAVQFTPYLSGDISVGRLSNAYNDDDYDSYSDNDDDDYDSYSSSDDEDWDAILDSYEEYVNDYISLLKKAKNGDMDALSEYPSIMEDAQELGEKLQNAQGSMSSSQLSRYTKITNKLAQAAANL